MQNIINTAAGAATSALNTATNLAGSATSAVGLTQPKTDVPHTTSSKDTEDSKGRTETMEAEGGASEAGSGLPADAHAEEVKVVDSEALAIFEEGGVRHDILVKINKLAIEDAKHGLKEVAALELVKDGVKKGIDFYHPRRYFKVRRPVGIDYIGEIEIEEGKSIHVRVHKANTTATPTFHSLDTRPSAQGGAVFETGEPLHWFEY